MRSPMVPSRANSIGVTVTVLMRRANAGAVNTLRQLKTGSVFGIALSNCVPHVSLGYTAKAPGR